ncbi:alpha/beta fold hydrolase [Chitinophagaceae bacterium MMS25-I14]
MDKVFYTSSADCPRIAYRKTGSGPVLILVHGFPESGILWQNVWPELSAHFTVIVPDLPGAGETVYEGSQLSMEQMAGTIKAVLDTELVEKCVIAGHSMGGYAAIAFAALYADRLKGLSFVHSGALADTEDKKETRRKSIELMRKDGGKEAFIRQMVPNLFAPSFKKIGAAEINRQTERALLLPVESMINFYIAMINRPERVEVLKKMAFPVQWIVGKEDTAIPVDKTMQQTYLARVNFVSVYPDCGHMAMLEQTERLISDLKLFTQFAYNSVI